MANYFGLVRKCSRDRVIPEAKQNRSMLMLPVGKTTLGTNSPKLGE